MSDTRELYERITAGVVAVLEPYTLRVDTDDAVAMVLFAEYETAVRNRIGWQEATASDRACCQTNAASGACFVALMAALTKGKFCCGLGASPITGPLCVVTPVLLNEIGVRGRAWCTARSVVQEAHAMLALEGHIDAEHWVMPVAEAPVSSAMDRTVGAYILMPDDVSRLRATAVPNIELVTPPNPLAFARLVNSSSSDSSDSSDSSSSDDDSADA